MAQRISALARITAALRIAACVLVVAALATQFVYSTRNVPTFRADNFFSFFTVESNIIGAVALLVGAITALRGHSGRGVALFRGAATLYMTVTGIVYALLLSGLEDQLQTQVAWVNTVLHYVMPVVLLADFLLDRSVKPIRISRAWGWLVYPIAYLIYSEVRGPVVHWYPYPFLDPGPHGVMGVVVTCLLIAIAVILIAGVLAWTTRVGSRRRLSAAVG